MNTSLKTVLKQPLWDFFFFAILLNPLFVHLSLHFSHIHTHTPVTHSCLLFAQIQRRWRYSVNFNTQILDILYGGELLFDPNQRLSWTRFPFLAAGNVSQPLSYIQVTVCSRFTFSHISTQNQLLTIDQSSLSVFRQQIFAAYDGSCTGKFNV